MVSTYSLQEKYNQVRRNFCFYLDVQDNGFARTLSKRIEDLGLQQEVFLTGRVTHIIRDTASPVIVGRTDSQWAPREGGRSRADAMLQRVRPDTQQRQPAQLQKNYITLTVQKAIILLDKIYDTFFTAPRKVNVKIFKKDYIKIEFLDKVCRPVYKEFDEWPEIPLDPDPPKDRKAETPEINQDYNQNIQNNTAGQKMTRKSRPRIKEKEEKEPKGGYCEMCNTDYADAALHRRSPHHLAFVRDHANFISLDSLIEAGADVSSFLDRATPINGERRSLRNICNGDVDTPRNRRSKRSQSPDSTVNGDLSPKRNGVLEDDRKHNTRCSKRSSESQLSEDRQYYKVVGVSTKLRSSGSLPVKRKDSPPTCNGAKPLVVKFRKVRRSELSVLSDEAEQFMFPKRASSTSSNSSEDEDDKESKSSRKSQSPQPSPTLERRRLARPLALKEESSEEDSWPEDNNRQRKRRVSTVVRRTRRFPSKTTPVEAEAPAIEELEIVPPADINCRMAEVSPLREEVSEKCMKWEDGKLKYTPAVEQLEFAFETVPHSEPWFETFKRQDEDKINAKNVPRYFSLYSTKAPKLPYEIGQLPPLKPNCCPLSDLVKRDDKAGPSRSYGTRGMKKTQKFKKCTSAQALIALEGQPRKSPREHASTLAILGSAGLLHRRKNGDDSKSTASEDTMSETQSTATKLEPIISETQEASERLQQFLSEVFEDAAEYDVSDELMYGDAAVVTSTNLPDVLNLVSECEGCEFIRDEIREGVAAIQPRSRRGKFRKRNRTGWPIKKKPVKKGSRANSSENKTESSLDRSSAEPNDDDTTQDSISEAEEHTLTEVDEPLTEADEPNLSEAEEHNPTEVAEPSLRKADKPTLGKADEPILTAAKSKDDVSLKNLLKSENSRDSESMELEAEKTEDEDSDDKPLKLDVKVLVQDKKEDKDTKADDKRTSVSSVSEIEGEEKSLAKKKRPMQVLGDWLQPVVRVARVDPNTARRLRSAGRGRSSRFR